MPRDMNDYFYDRYMRKKYTPIPPDENFIPVDQEINQIEQEMAKYLTPQEEKTRQTIPFAELKKALGIPYGSGVLSNIIKSRRGERPNMMVSMPNPRMRNNQNIMSKMALFNNMIQEAEYNYRNKDYDNAASVLSQAESLMPNNPQIQKLKLAIKKGSQNQALTQRYQKSNSLMRSFDRAGLGDTDNQLIY
jgi:hypothetical protein